MKPQLLFLSVLTLAACKSPTQLLDEGKHNSAFKKAIKEIKYDKNVQENTRVLKATAEFKVNEAIQYSRIKSKTQNVKDWIKTQTKIYTLLEDLGKANTITNGSISDSYDLLCNEKKDLDYQIVEFYYDEGQEHLDRFYRDGQKNDARKAYYSFKNCEKYEGQSHFLNLADQIKDAHKKGIVYYVSNYRDMGNKLFLKPLPGNADFLPDCDIYVDQGYVTVSEDRSSKSKDYEKEVEVGREEITDTSGNVTYKTIFETRRATVTTTTITLTATVTTFINSKNVTGQCNISSTQFTTRESDSYNEVSIDGDVEALQGNIREKSGSPAGFESNLQSKVMRRAERRIGL